MEINNIDKNAYKSWFKESFELVKRSPLMFLLISLFPLLFFLGNNYIIIIPSILIYSGFFMIFFSFKTDNSISFNEAFENIIKKSKSKSTSKFKTFLLPYNSILLVAIISIIITILKLLNFDLDINKNFSINSFTVFSCAIAAFLGSNSTFSNFNVLHNIFKKYVNIFNIMSCIIENKEINKKSIYIVKFCNYITFYLILSTLMFFKDFKFESIILYGFLFTILSFLKVVEYVAFREIFLGIRKNKDKKSEECRNINIETANLKTNS